MPIIHATPNGICGVCVCFHMYVCMYMPMYTHARTHVHALLPVFSRAEISSPGQQLEEALEVPQSPCAGGGILPVHLVSISFLPCTGANVGRKISMSSPSVTVVCASAPRRRRRLSGNGPTQVSAPRHRAHGVPKCMPSEDAIPGTEPGARRGPGRSCLCVCHSGKCVNGTNLAVKTEAGAVGH